MTEAREREVKFRAAGAAHRSSGGKQTTRFDPIAKKPASWK